MGARSWRIYGPYAMKTLARKMSHSYERFRLRGRAFAIISNNCWGYEIYGAVGREYNTPFVGLFLPPESYLQLLENFVECLQSPLTFGRAPRFRLPELSYPIGWLRNEVEIHFLHYSTEVEARSKWSRRVARLLAARDAGATLCLKFCDRDGGTLSQFSRFHALSWGHKMSIGIRNFDMPNHLCRTELKDPQGDYVVDGVKLYAKRYRYFDITEWILTGRVQRTSAASLLGLFS